jgi:hypothetical protein
MKYPKVCIIILNWNGLKDTLECLESVYELDYRNFEVIVVDNGSQDESVSAIKRNFPDVILIENKENLGFAGGNNVGIKFAIENGADFVFLLNNDTVVAPDTLARMVEAYDNLENAGFLGCKIYFYDRPNVIQHFGGEIMFEPVLYGRHIGDGDEDRGQFEYVQKCDYVTGCAVFASRSVIDRVGVLDERYFAYWEDADWGMRANRLGLNNYVIPAAKVWHKVSSSLDGGSHPLRYYFIARNRLLFASKFESYIPGLRDSASRAIDEEREKLTRTGYWLRKTAARALKEGIKDFQNNKFEGPPKWLKKNKKEFHEFKIHFLKNNLYESINKKIRHVIKQEWGKNHFRD